MDYVVGIDLGTSNSVVAVVEDGSPVVIDDHLLVGGENSNFHVVRLHRGYGPDGHVRVAPELLAVVPGWDDELRRSIGDDNVSIENSVTIVDDVVYFSNSGGLVQGWDLAPVLDGGQPERVFRYWIGDDTDASVVVAYVARMPALKVIR